MPAKHPWINLSTRVALVCTLLVLAALVLPLSANAASLDPASHVVSPAQRLTGYLHTDGARLRDEAGREVRITGVNWFGLETEAYAPHGLHTRSWTSLLDEVASLGFNTIRLPYTNQLFEQDSVPGGINYEVNADLRNLTGQQIMDKVIKGAGERNLKVILDRHRPDASSQSSLWYTQKVSEQQWLADWKMLAARYKGNSTVIGMDLHNEPRGEATWGSDDPSSDWRLAAERAGNAILDINPNLLIIVQGIEVLDNDWYWWGGNLQGVAKAPVRLKVPGRLVYSTHDYGPGVYGQGWFNDPRFPANLPEVWDKHWGYIVRQGIAPVLVGEFGGRSVSPATSEGQWQASLVAYLKANGMSYTYWTLNPNSGDTGGILKDDWRTVDDAKMRLLATYQWPLIGLSPRELTRLSSSGVLPARDDKAPGSAVPGPLRGERSRPPRWPVAL